MRACARESLLVRVRVDHGIGTSHPCAACIVLLCEGTACCHAGGLIMEYGSRVTVLKQACDVRTCVSIVLSEHVVQGAHRRHAGGGGIPSRCSTPTK